ncbi:MAG: hypothetical protein RQ783_08885 [Gammaproteobacteria bacterium]|nr:hypothetical protein [Gammaproteobacteria bacterium]
MAEKRDPSSQLTNVSFKCSECGHKFSLAPSRIEDAPERDHPFRYFANCPRCESESNQVAWEQALMASYGKHTGPKTDDGKQNSSANLNGHPTPEETLRTRFNAMKHGLSARTATYFPAKPGKYAHCNSCDIDWGTCMSNVACMKRTELFMRYDIAFKSKDPGLLQDIYSDFHANLQAIINDIILSIVGDGVTIRMPAYSIEKGEIKIGTYTDATGAEKIIYDEIKAHPLLKVLTEMTSRNSMSLADMGMTPKVVDDQEITMGHLSEQKEDKETLLNYQENQRKQLDNLQQMIANSQQRIKNDPVVIEHNNG